MNANLKSLYDKLPAFVQNSVLTGYSFLLDLERYSGKYTQYKKLLTESQWYSDVELETYQNEQLTQLVRHAYNTVPYYNRIFKERNLKPDDIKKSSDLLKLPVLRRKDIQEKFHELQSDKIDKRKLKLGHTSGTTGTPLEVGYDSNVIYFTYALMDRQYQWADVNLAKFGDRVAVLRGNVIVPIEQKNPPFWRYNYLHNQLLMSAFHMSQKNLQHYLDKLWLFRPAVIDGYPSTLYVFARFLLNNNLTFPMKAIISSSETLYDFQREAIEKAFVTDVFDYYAAAERVIFATECNHHKGHHISSEYGILEVLDQKERPVSAGQAGLMVGTSLHNYGMPLLRYETSDISAFKTEKCSCGRGLPLMDDVATKSEDIIALKDGRMISPSVLTHPFKPMHGIEASQIIQEDYEHVRIKIVKNNGYKDSDSAHLIKEFKNRLGEDVRVDIVIVDELSRTKSGKFKWVISKVDKGIKVPS